MKCYLCQNEATSVEHCPAKSFFPNDKRINLITVPSCSIHNEGTSLDDEYVRNLIAITKGNNEVAERHFMNKGIRSLQRNAGLRSLFTTNTKKLNFIKDDENSKNIAFEVDRNRFDKVMRKVAYGIYYFNFYQTWNYELVVATQHLVTEELEADFVAEKVKAYKNDFKMEITFKGENPDVFKYYFFHFTKNPNKVLVMKFYDWFEVWIFPNINSLGPSLDI